MKVHQGASSETTSSSVTLYVLSPCQEMNRAVDSEVLEYSVHAGVQTTLQVLLLGEDHRSVHTEVRL